MIAKGKTGRGFQRRGAVPAPRQGREDRRAGRVDPHGEPAHRPAAASLAGGGLDGGPGPEALKRETGQKRIRRKADKPVLSPGWGCAGVVRLLLGHAPESFDARYMCKIKSLCAHS